MPTSIFQMRIDSNLLDSLKAIASYKGINVTAFVKMKLTEGVRNEQKNIFTENELTADQELEIIRREKEVIADYKKGIVKPMSGKVFLKKLYA